MSVPEIAATVAIITSVASAVLMVWDRSQRRARLDSALKEAIVKTKSSSHDDISQLRIDIVEGFERLRREFGETGSALREKIMQVELFVRDNFVSKPTFTEVTARIAAECKSDANESKLAIERTNHRIDRIHPSQALEPRP